MRKLNQVPEQVNLLIVKFLTEDMSDDDLKALSEWLRAGESNREYFNSIKSGWLLSGVRGDKEKFDTVASYKKLKNLLPADMLPVRRRINSRIFRWYHAAAIGLIFFLLGSLTVIFLNGISQEVTMADNGTEIVSPYGSKSRILLSDGSEVWLNAGSKLKYRNDFNRSERNLELSGEAFFNVTTDNDKPFTVRTNRMTVKAYGTVFNVKSYPDENHESAILVEGNIDVEVRIGEKKSDTYKLKPNDRLVLVDERATITNLSDTKNISSEKHKIVPVKVDFTRNIKTELYTSWKDDRWLIEKEPLESLIPLLERRYNLKFHFESDTLKDYKFTGTIQNETIEQILEAMTLTAPLKYSIIMDSVVLSFDEKYAEQYKRITKRN